MTGFELYRQKQAELEQAAKDITDELLAEIGKFKLEGVTQVSRNIAVVKLSSLCSSTWAPESYVLDSQKEAIKAIILRCQPDVSWMVKELRKVCETGKYRKSKKPNDVIVFHPDFIRQLEALLPKKADGQACPCCDF